MGMTSPITRRAFAASFPLWRLLGQDGLRLVSDSEWSRTRDIYTAERADKPALGIRFSVLLKENGNVREVSTQHKFRSGDRFRLQVGMKNDAYLYIVNTTVPGNPDTLPRGIEVVRINNKPRPDVKYRLIYPPKGERPKKLDKAKTHVLPVDFVMDNNAGLENLFLIVSREPVNLSRFFKPDGSMQTGVAAGTITGPAAGAPPSASPPASVPPASDTNQSVLDSLNRQLTEWAENTELGLAAGDARGVEVVSYAVPRKDKQPFVVTVNLLHYPK
jgi:hypothetical protein